MLKLQKRLPPSLTSSSKETASAKKLQETIQEEPQKEHKSIENPEHSEEPKTSEKLEEKKPFAKQQQQQTAPVDLPDEQPVPESEVRTALRSPHIKISGGKIVLDYGTQFGSQGFSPSPSGFPNKIPDEQQPVIESLEYGSAEASYNEQDSSAMSYGKVFGMNAYDYAFDFVPPTYRRHRRHSDSDSESVRNFMSDNMPIHGILELEEKKPTPLQPMKWISKKARRKSEDNRRKAFPVRWGN